MKSKLMLLGILAVSLAVSLAASAGAAAELTLPEEVNLGSVAINTTQNASFTITNGGDEALNNIVISCTADSKYNVEFSATGIASIAAESSQTITLNATIPYGESQGLKTLGNIEVSSDEASSSTPLKVKVTGKLIIVEVDVDVDNEENNDLHDGDAISKTASPSSTIEFDVKVKNIFTTSEGIKIEDAFVKVIIEGIEDGEDLEKESNTFTLNADRTHNEEFTFEIPSMVDEDTYTVIISAEGEDEDNNPHKAEIELELEVERKNHEILVKMQSITPETIKCGGQADVEFSLVNYGKSDEEDAAYNIRNHELGISVSGGPIFLYEIENDDEEYKQTISRTITIKETAPVGSYPIEIRSFYDFDKVDDIARVHLTIEECVQDVEEPEQAETAEEIQQPEETEEKTDTEPVQTAPSEDELFIPEDTEETSQEGTEEKEGILSRFSGGMKTALLVLANIIVLIIVGVIFVKFFRARKGGEENFGGEQDIY